MRTTIINNKTCSTIEDFYSISVPKIRYSQTKHPIPLVCDFYREFLVDGKRLPDKQVVEEWHDLLMWYINQPDAIFFVRKYEGGKKNGEWDNRRGAVVQFDDGFEIVYSSNFLAHDIFLMAYHGFVPDKNDFMTTIKNRKLHITSGTKVEKEIRTYTLANKGLSYCYLAHIMDVNGNYLRNDRTYKSLLDSEENRMFPRGVAANWKSAIDGIWHTNYSLSREEKDLVKAHCIRFLDPMNYYLTPLTNQSCHTIKNFKKNIGEYKYLTYYVEQQYKHIFGNRFDELVNEGKYLETVPKGYTGNEKINLEYSVNNSTKSSATSGETKLPSTKKEKGVTINMKIDEFLDEYRIFLTKIKPKSASAYRGYLMRLYKEMIDVKKLLDKIIKEKDLLKKLKYSVQLVEIVYCAKETEKDEKRKKVFSDAHAAAMMLIDFLHHKHMLFDVVAVENNTNITLDEKTEHKTNGIYIRYKKGWSSFMQVDEHVTGYCIDNDTISISYGVGFIGGRKAHKKISNKDMKELIEILDIARNNSLFEKSNTHIITEHGPVSSYDYQYRDNSGMDCRGLFIDNKMTEVLQIRYSNLINKLTK